MRWLDWKLVAATGACGLVAVLGLLGHGLIESRHQALQALDHSITELADCVED